ncbi:hypothetical protein LA76x_2241 [Lysobacter antibioticus]|uniref:Uncharacterized protein n=1 Tax=Lysobacter antibioticus TaxID=84531 RepID=A0A0S2FA09_LYSAN|nr:hypothetical protein LA76x_2241 [Lysobacter antibioticus]
MAGLAMRSWAGRRAQAMAATVLRKRKKPACAGLSWNWWAVQGSNLRPSPCEGDALPLS